MNPYITNYFIQISGDSTTSFTISGSYHGWSLVKNTFGCEIDIKLYAVAGNKISYHQTLSFRNVDYCTSTNTLTSHPPLPPTNFRINTDIPQEFFDPLVLDFTWDIPVDDTITKFRVVILTGDVNIFTDLPISNNWSMSVDGTDCKINFYFVFNK